MAAASNFSSTDILAPVLALCTFSTNQKSQEIDDFFFLSEALLNTDIVASIVPSLSPTVYERLLSSMGYCAKF